MFKFFVAPLLAAGSMLLMAAHPAPTAPTVMLTDFSQDYLMGKFQVASHPDFALVPSALTDGRQAYYLRKEAVAALKNMAAAAQKEGISLKVISATRNFQHQKQIWEAKWNGSTLVAGKNLAKTEPNAAKRALKILT